MQFAIVVACALMTLAGAAQQLYTSEFDEIDVKAIIDNPRLFNNNVQCLKGLKSGCPKSVLKLKELLPDALKTGCEKCTPAQKAKGREVIDYVIQKRPDVFLELEEIFDKEHVYRNKYADRLKAAGIKLPDLH